MTMAIDWITVIVSLILAIAVIRATWRIGYARGWRDCEIGRAAFDLWLDVYGEGEQ
jgi:hypothetical protein